MDNAMEPVARDLRSTCAVTAVFRDTGDGVWVLDEDGIGQLVSSRPDEPAADRVARFAGQVQDWAVEALWRAAKPAVWPECPEHPDSHPLAATVADERAVWACPRTGVVVAGIGGL